ncbi:hypothetical protein GCM10009836_67570 [Pseudonocardia ailaonensis]|uniref:Uncharacterized protein n=1 Tax=Pseudonocardia ailaonensis TaxID=367279 RepID=A0ABN2NNB4_9PSEU
MTYRACVGAGHAGADGDSGGMTDPGARVVEDVSATSGARVGRIRGAVFCRVAEGPGPVDVDTRVRLGSLCTCAARRGLGRSNLAPAIQPDVPYQVNEM